MEDAGELDKISFCGGGGTELDMSQGEVGKWGLFSMDYSFLTMRVVRKEGF